MPKPYAEVRDERRMCLSHGGRRLRGDYTVYVDGEEVWRESDTWQSSEMAKEACENLAGLLDEAHKKGKESVRKKSRKS